MTDSRKVPEIQIDHVDHLENENSDQMAQDKNAQMVKILNAKKYLSAIAIQVGVCAHQIKNAFDTTLDSMGGGNDEKKKPKSLIKYSADNQRANDQIIDMFIELHNKALDLQIRVGEYENLLESETVVGEDTNLEKYILDVESLILQFIDATKNVLIDPNLEFAIDSILLEIESSKEYKEEQLRNFIYMQHTGITTQQATEQSEELLLKSPWTDAKLGYEIAMTRQIPLIIVKLNDLEKQLKNKDFSPKKEEFPIAIDQYVASGLKAIERKANDRGIKVVLLVNDLYDYNVYCDYKKLIDILDVNLHNAVKYSVANSCIQAKISVENDCFIFELSNRSKVFNPEDIWARKQIDNKTAGVKGGTGKGMIFMRSLVEFLDGEIGLEFLNDNNETDNTATFVTRIKIPVRFVNNEAELIPCGTPRSTATPRSTSSTGTPLSSTQPNFAALVLTDSYGYHAVEGFRTRVPQYDEETEQNGQAIEREKMVAGSVLLAEDNIINQKVAVRLLLKAGFKLGQIIICNDANDVRSLFIPPTTGGARPIEKVNLILADCDMPYGKGYEVLGELKALKELDNNALDWFAQGIAYGLTGHAEEHIAELFTENGATGVIVKAVKQDDINNILEKYFIMPQAEVLTPPQVVIADTTAVAAVGVAEQTVEIANAPQPEIIPPPHEVIDEHGSSTFEPRNTRRSSIFNRVGRNSLGTVISNVELVKNAGQDFDAEAEKLRRFSIQYQSENQIEEVGDHKYKLPYSDAVMQNDWTLQVDNSLPRLSTSRSATFGQKSTTPTEQDIQSLRDYRFGSNKNKK